MFRTAWPPDTVARPLRLLPPSLNCTSPPGVPGPLTVAVKVTCWPKTVESGDAESAVVVFAGATLTLTVFDVLTA